MPLATTTTLKQAQMSNVKTEYGALLFDLDGTVLDTKDLILASYHYACEKVLGYLLPDEPLLDLIGVPLPDQMRLLIDPEHVDAMITAYREHNANHHDEYIGYFPGTAEAIDCFAAAGWPMAIVTSKRNASARQGLDIFGLTEKFLFLIGSDDSEKHKPDPEPLLLAAKRLGLDPADCVYIGDSPYDMQAAVAAGMLPIGAEWGFFTRERLLQAGAFTVVEKISDLPEALKSLKRKSLD